MEYRFVLTRVGVGAASPSSSWHLVILMVPNEGPPTLPVFADYASSILVSQSDLAKTCPVCMQQTETRRWETWLAGSPVRAMTCKRNHVPRVIKRWHPHVEHSRDLIEWLARQKLRLPDWRRHLSRTNRVFALRQNLSRRICTCRSGDAKWRPDRRGTESERRAEAAGVAIALGMETARGRGGILIRLRSAPPAPRASTRLPQGTVTEVWQLCDDFAC